MYLVTWLEAQVPEPLDDEVLRTFLLEVWDSVFDIAGRGSEYRLDLECLMSMLRQKVMEDAKGTPITCAGRRVWKDLPTFGRVAVEKYSFMTDPWDRDSPMSTEDYRRIGYLTDFLASLTMRPEVNEEVTEDPLNFIYFGLWSLRTALERTPSKDGCWCGTVRVAARWIMRAGPKIWLLSEKGHDLPRGAGMGGDKVLSKNWWGFNRERWDFWRRRFAGFRATTADREMLDLLDDVLRDMHALQGNALGTTTPVSEAIVF
ncbi:hypothetical protein QBC47DRAFT_306274 [Echria macrotheca]|uniref:Uncharacterized protein n=1 Tax=Echria macrotheca TaxID=438768 RepID=A0AAJ0B746_9PEZI|nr:hypothetical protein QBC47DRAFT_306274 [Echria macrotheca]